MKVWGMANINWNADKMRVSLNTKSPQSAIDPHLESTRLFVIDADGKRQECQKTGPGTFAAPANFTALRWEIHSETTGSVMKGTFDNGADQ